MPVIGTRRSRRAFPFWRTVAPASLLGGCCAWLFSDPTGHGLLHYAIALDMAMLVAMTYVIHKLTAPASEM